MQKYANITDTFCQFLMILYLCTAFGHIQRPIIMPKSIKTIAPIDSISGMIGSREGYLCGKAIIANIRKRGGQKYEGKPHQYFSVSTRSTATTVLTPKILERRAKFGAVVRATYARLADTAQAAQDMVNFKNQTKYKTMYSYIFRLEWDAYTA